MRIGSVRSSVISSMFDRVAASIEAAPCLQDACQILVSELYGELSESVVLARAFLSLPIGVLPPSHRSCVDSLLGSAGVVPAEDSTALVLLGSSGRVDIWNSVYRSQGHRVIPLATADFVDRIPMMSRMLKSMGLPLSWTHTSASRIVGERLGKSAGVFFVRDAESERDDQGRYIIPARSFIAEHGVRSVFAVGGAYFGGSLLIMIVFCNEVIDPGCARKALPLVSLFKARTQRWFSPRRVLSADWESYHGVP